MFTRKLSTEKAKDILDNITKRENTKHNQDAVLKSLAELSDELRRQGQLTEEYKQLMLDEVEKRIAAG